MCAKSSDENTEEPATSVDGGMSSGKEKCAALPRVLLFAKAEECAPLTQQYFIVNVAVPFQMCSNR